ncbi:uncharacterized protein EV420DRAFT_1651420 [Desarmillaria tabescens]|uniref:JmjC domain-containing protein n=1 Tax=Armillaria tabescens TaxID=1929756 RepID=A0AA39JAP7_ARMTA|nr:uncharacterized protein EV420DRAFT_1651420 [Desarmillaria tabescens]KAK0438495.1 hypothetical protein EV420DRAFT_1651420 [Desarmillaria tabescens]
MPLDPEQWFHLRSMESDIELKFLQFGMAMARSLKSIADEGWEKVKGGKPKNHIDNIGGGRNASKFAGHLETLILVRAVDITAGFLRLPTRSYYPSFQKSISLDKRQMGKLAEIQTSLRMYKERASTPLPPLAPGASFMQEILHGDHSGVEQTTHWQRFINENFNHPDIQTIMGNEETLKKFKQSLPRWKQSFANAMAISPLLLIMGQGMGQTLNTSLALQVGGRLSSIGKPDLIVRVEELLWHCIIGIAWGSWMSKVGLMDFLEAISPLINNMKPLREKQSGATPWDEFDGEDTWFKRAIHFIQQNDVAGLGARELDDRITIHGWNDCIVNDKTGSPWYKPDTGKGLEESMIVTLSFSNAMKNPMATLETFCNYHIFLYGTKTSPLTWSLNDLSKTKDYLHVNLSLCEIYEEGLEDEGRVLNALSLPCSTSETGHPLQLIVSSHIRAFEQTSDLPEDIFDTSYPISATNFWLVVMKGVISYIHSDCHGVGTFVEVLCGRKLWYVFQHHGSRRQDSRIDEYMGDWAPGFILDPREWEAKVVLLEPGSAFYMCPDTHHAVLTLENCIVRGGHFYSTVTLSKTVSGWVHTCMLGYRIINVVHPELHQLLLCMMCYFHTVIGEKGPETQDTDIPSITRDGLLELIALGNLCIFGSALLPCILPDSADAMRPAITMAIGAYISIIRCLRVDFGLVFLAENNAVEPSINSTILVDDKLSIYAWPIFLVRKKVDLLDPGAYFDWNTATDFDCSDIEDDIDDSDGDDRELGKKEDGREKEDGHGRDDSWSKDDDSWSKDDDTEKKKDAPEELQESDVESEPMSGEDESMHSEYMPSKSVL